MYVEGDVFRSCEVFPNADDICCAMHFIPITPGTYRATDGRCSGVNPSSLRADGIKCAALDHKALQLTSVCSVVHALYWFLAVEQVPNVRRLITERWHQFAVLCMHCICFLHTMELLIDDCTDATLAQ